MTIKDRILTLIATDEQLLNTISSKLSLKKEDILSEINGSSTPVMYIDGGSRGNPGESGSGIVIENNKTKTGYYFYEGIGTNNEAEYRALIRGLKLIIDEGHKSVTVFSDSELICKQVNGIYKVKHPEMIKCHAEVTELIRQLKSFSISHVLREKNRDADKMANTAMDTKKNGRVELTVAAEISL